MTDERDDTRADGGNATVGDVVAPTVARSPLALWLVGLTAVFAAVCLWSATVGSAEISVTSVARIVLAQAGVLPYEAPGHHEYIVVYLRLPRIALGAAVGFALAAAGTVMQGFFRNPMADPSIVGVSAGAATGAVAFIVLPLSLPFGIPVAAFAGATVTAFAVYLIATEGGRTPVATLLLAGVAVQTFLGAVVSLLLVRSTDAGLRRAILWLMGSLRGSSWNEVATVAAVAALGVAFLFAYARELDLLLLGEEEAATLGVEVKRAKRVLLAASAVVTGAAVAFVGVIGFVGLIVPHVMRLLVGPDHRALLPTSAVAGAAFLVAADTVARSGAAELPVGIVTAFVGAPFFLFLLRKREVHTP
jgi:iron complex transport system permease protein